MATASVLGSPIALSNLGVHSLTMIEGDTIERQEKTKRTVYKHCTVCIQDEVCTLIENIDFYKINL